MVTITCEGGCQHRGKCGEAMGKLTMQLLQLLSGSTIISKRKIKFGLVTPQIKSGLEAKPHGTLDPKDLLSRKTFGHLGNSFGNLKSIGYQVIGRTGFI